MLITPIQASETVPIPVNVKSTNRLGLSNPIFKPKVKDLGNFHKQMYSQGSEKKDILTLTHFWFFQLFGGF